MLLAFGIPLATIPFFFGEKMLLLIGQDPEVALLAGQYMKAALPSVLLLS